MKRKNNYSNKHKSKRRLWIAFGIAAALIASVIGFFLYRNWQEEQLAIERREAVEEVVEDYFSALIETDFNSFVNTLSDESVNQSDSTKDEISERYENIFQSIGIEDVALSDLSLTLDEETDEYTLDYTLEMRTTLGPLENVDYQTMVHETEEEISIAWDWSLLFPGMVEGDTISLSFIEATRGSIYDRHGNMLAGEGDAWEAGLYPAILGDEDEREGQLEEISQTFSISTDQLESLLNQNWVTDESFVPFMIVDEGDTPEVPGVMYQRTIDRIYPLAEAGAHLIGYTGEVTAEDLENDSTLTPGEIIGKVGLEAVFEDELSGETGGEIIILDSDQEEKEVLIENEKMDGESIHLTIDSEVQQSLFDAFEGETGASTLMDPVTGELIALVSAPSYDPQSFAREISQEDYNAYLEDEQNPFLNRATARYAPGSTFKLLTSMVLLEEGVTDPEDVNQIEGLQWSPDLESFGDRQITRVTDTVTEVDLSTALIYSDNIFFAMEALEFGEDEFEQALLRFPFGESMELPIDMRSAQFAGDNTIDSETLLADTAYGQGEVLMNSIHQLVFFSPVLNNGELTSPQIVQDESNSSSEAVASQETAQFIENSLIEAVTDPNGTANELDSLAYSVGAKTGTAEVAGEEGNDTNGFLYVFDAEDYSYSFIGFLEDQRSGDVINQFRPFLNDVKASIE